MSSYTSSLLPVAVCCMVTLAFVVEADVGALVPADQGQGFAPTLSFTSAESFRVATNGTDLVMAMVSELWDIAHVDGAYRSSDSDEGIELVVAAARHGLIDRDRLFEAEDRLGAIALRPVNIRVIAHQGRAVSTLAGNGLLFERG